MIKLKVLLQINNQPNLKVFVLLFFLQTEKGHRCYYEYISFKQCLKQSGHLFK